MTDKRFYIEDEHICDKEHIIEPFWIETFAQAKSVVDALNNYEEKVKLLKRQIDNLEHTRDFCAECCERLEKENEQLKSEIKEVRGAYEQLWMRL